MSTRCHFRISTQRVTFETWDPSDIWSERWAEKINGSQHFSNFFLQDYQIVMSGQFCTLAMFMMASLFLSLKQVNVDVDFVSHICFVRNDAHTVVQPGHCLGEFFCPSGASAETRWNERIVQPRNCSPPSSPMCTIVSPCMALSALTMGRVRSRAPNICPNLTLNNPAHPGRVLLQNIGFINFSAVKRHSL